MIVTFHTEHPVNVLSGVKTQLTTVGLLSEDKQAARGQTFTADGGVYDDRISSNWLFIIGERVLTVAPGRGKL